MYVYIHTYNYMHDREGWGRLLEARLLTVAARAYIHI